MVRACQDTSLTWWSLPTIFSLWVMVVEFLKTIFSIFKNFRKKDIKLHSLFTEHCMVVAVCHPIMIKWMNRVSFRNPYQLFQSTFTCWLSLLHYSNAIINVLIAKGEKNPNMLVTTTAVYQMTNNLINKSLRDFTCPVYSWNKLIWQHWLNNLILPFYKVVFKIINC